jgi:hypothetical protein
MMHARIRWSATSLKLFKMRVLAGQEPVRAVICAVDPFVLLCR